MDSDTVVGVSDVIAELRRLRRDCGEAYQVLGALRDDPDLCRHPEIEKALDNLSAASVGKPRPHDDLLPWPGSRPIDQILAVVTDAPPHIDIHPEGSEIR